MTFAPPALYPDGGQVTAGEMRYLGYSLVIARLASRLAEARRNEDTNFVFRRYVTELDAEIFRDGFAVATLSYDGAQPTLAWASPTERDLFDRRCNDWAETFEWRAELWSEGRLPDNLDPRIAGQRAFVPVPREWIVDFRKDDELLPRPPRSARFLAFLIKQSLESDLQISLSALSLSSVASVIRPQ